MSNWLKTVKVILICSALISIIELVYKIFIMDTPPELAVGLSALLPEVYGRVYDRPGLIHGLFSGLVSPIANIFAVLDSVGMLGDGGNGRGLNSLIRAFAQYGQADHHFGFGYDIGFVVGLFFAVAIIAAIGEDYSEPDNEASNKEQQHSNSSASSTVADLVRGVAFIAELGAIYMNSKSKDCDAAKTGKNSSANFDNKSNSSSST